MLSWLLFFFLVCLLPSLNPPPVFLPSSPPDLAVLLLRAVQRAVRPVELVEAEGDGHVVHVPPAVLPLHLAAVVVELSVRPAGELGDPPAAGVAVRRRLAVATVDRHHALTGEEEEGEKK